MHFSTISVKSLLNIGAVIEVYRYTDYVIKKSIKLIFWYNFSLHKCVEIYEYRELLMWLYGYLFLCNELYYTLDFF